MPVRASLPTEFSSFDRFLRSHYLSLRWSEKHEWVLIDCGQVMPVRGEIRIAYLSLGLQRSVAARENADLFLTKDLRDWRDLAADKERIEDVRGVAVPLVRDFVNGLLDLRVDDEAGIEVAAPAPRPPAPPPPAPTTPLPQRDSGSGVRGLLRLLRSRPAPIPPEPPKVASASPRISPPGEADAAAIREFVRERGVSRLVHFTRAENVERIREQGLLPRTALELGEPRPRFPDSYRLDGHKDAVCLSIGFPNYKMFYKYRRESEGWVVFEIEPSVLWTHPCAFFPKNAATNECTSRPLSDFVCVSALRAMFDGNRPSDLRADYPTDPQAEVLVFGTIESRLIREPVATEKAGFSRQGDDLFVPRSDWRFWPAQSSQEFGTWP